MKILVVTPYLPAPPNTGGRRRMHALISRLSDRHDVTVVSFIDETGEPTAVEATRRICRRLVIVANDTVHATGTAKRRVQLRSVISAASHASHVLRTLPMQRAIDDLAREGDFDLTLVEFAQMAGYRFPAGSAVVLDEHNIEYDIVRRTYAGERGAVRKVFSYLEHRKLRAEERTAWARVDACAFTSARDLTIAREAQRHVPMRVVPNGVDLREFQPGPARPGYDVLFVGADFRPNNDAVRFYADEVFPAVLQAEPRARFVVVGGAGLALTDRRRRSVVLLGAVEDVRPYITRAAVVVAPLRIGGGTRLKILEAMAMARPVVASGIGAEGIEAVPNRDLFIADDAAGLARATGRILADPEFGNAVGANGRALVERRYDWDAIVGDFDRFVRTLLAPRRTYRFAFGRGSAG